MIKSETSQAYLAHGKPVCILWAGKANTGMGNKVISLLMVCLMVFSLGVFAIEADELTAKSAILMEASTGMILFEKNIDQQCAIASITKLMTLTIAMEKIESGEMYLDDLVVGSPTAKAVGGSTIYLEVGEKMTVDDIIKGICINSGNDATIALAETIAGSEGEFVKIMNQRAGEIGLTNTNFVNCTGLDAPGHVSSARDVALISRNILLNHRKILDYSKIWLDSLRGGRTMLANTNQLLKDYQYATGLKTGTEDDAGYCLAATAEKDGMELIAVVLGVEDDTTRFQEAQMMLEWGYSNYQVKKIGVAGDTQASVPIKKGTVPEMDAVMKEDLSVIVPMTYADKTITEVQIEAEIPAPAAKDMKVGELIVKASDQEVGRVELILKEDVKKMTFFQALGSVFMAWFQFSF